MVKRIEQNERETVRLQRRGFRYTMNLPKGHVLTNDDVFPLRPIAIDGIPPFEIDKIIGRSINEDVKADTDVKYKHLNL